MPKITKKEVEHAARLARLKLSNEEKESFTIQLGKILEYIEQLNKLNTEGVEPTSHVLPMDNVWREDKFEPCSEEERERLLKNAPDREGNFFKVKKVIE